MKTADRENSNSRDRLRNASSPWGGGQAPSLDQAGWKVRKFPEVEEVFFLTFSFIELIGTWIEEHNSKSLHLKRDITPK
jgi:hypothetical protein